MTEPDAYGVYPNIPLKGHEYNCKVCLEPQFCDCKCETCEESRRKWIHDYEYRKYLDDILDPRD